MACTEKQGGIQKRPVVMLFKISVLIETPTMKKFKTQK